MFGLKIIKLNKAKVDCISGLIPSQRSVKLNQIQRGHLDAIVVRMAGVVKGSKKLRNRKRKGPDYGRSPNEPIGDSNAASDILGGHFYKEVVISGKDIRLLRQYVVRVLEKNCGSNVQEVRIVAESNTNVAV